MKIRVMGVLDVRELSPTNLTYLIRIKRHTPTSLENDLFLRIPFNPNYRHIHEYRIDDYNPKFETEGYTPPSNEEAEAIVRDFQTGREDCNELLVHCLRGLNRSPAVAMALNDLFSLGSDTKEMREQFPYYNQWLYQFILEAGRRILK